MPLCSPCPLWLKSIHHFTKLIFVIAPFNTRDEKYTLPTRKSMKSGMFPGFPEPSAFPSFYKNSDLG